MQCTCRVCVMQNRLAVLQQGSEQCVLCSRAQLEPKQPSCSIYKCNKCDLHVTSDSITVAAGFRFSDVAYGRNEHDRHEDCKGSKDLMQGPRTTGCGVSGGKPGCCATERCKHAAPCHSLVPTVDPTAACRLVGCAGPPYSCRSTSMMPHQLHSVALVPVGSWVWSGAARLAERLSEMGLTNMHS